MTKVLVFKLHEKGGKHHSTPCHHAFTEALRTYIDAAGIVEGYRQIVRERAWQEPGWSAKRA